MGGAPSLTNFVSTFVSTFVPSMPFSSKKKDREYSSLTKKEQANLKESIYIIYDVLKKDEYIEVSSSKKFGREDGKEYTFKFERIYSSVEEEYVKKTYYLDPKSNEIHDHQFASMQQILANEKDTMYTKLGYTKKADDTDTYLNSNFSNIYKMDDNQKQELMQKWSDTLPKYKIYIIYTDKKPIHITNIYVENDEIKMLTDIKYIPTINYITFIFKNTEKI